MNTSTSAQLAERLRSARVSAGVTRAALASAMSCDASTISRYERGVIALSPARFEQARQALGRVLSGVAA